MCNQKDFGYDEKSIKEFELINNLNYLFLCVDWSNNNTSYLSGDFAPNYGNLSYLQFNISKCNK
jgi:hypothetical protein